MSEAAAVAEPPDQTVERRREAHLARPKRQPRYNVILWNDDDHTFEYVIRMLGEPFGYPPEKAFEMAHEVDVSGRAIVLTTTKEHAELKRDQIHAFGRDPFCHGSKGSMSASIEPAPGQG